MLVGKHTCLRLTKGDINQTLVKLLLGPQTWETAMKQITWK